MYFYDIVGRKVLESLVKEPSKIRPGTTLDADDQNNNNIYRRYDGTAVTDKPFKYEDTPYYIINLEYSWRAGHYVWNIREEFKTKDDFIRALSINRVQGIKLPEIILRDVLMRTQTYNLARHTAIRRKEGGVLDYSKINKNTLYTFDIENLPNVATHFTDENDRSFIEDIINKYIDSKTKISELAAFNKIIENYIDSFDTYEKQSEAFWFCVETMEKRFKIKTSQRCRRFMTTTFAGCITNAFGEDKKTIQAERDYYLVNKYFKYYTDSWSCRNIIVECLDHIEDMSDADLTTLMYCLSPELKEKIMKKVNNTEVLSDIDLLTKRVYCNNGMDNTRCMLIELIYTIISRFTPEEFKKTNVDLLADAIVKTKSYERGYSSLLAQDELLTQKENMDYLAERVIEKLAEKRQPNSYIETVINQVNPATTVYFYKSLKHAAETSENKKVKKAIFRMNV